MQPLTELLNEQANLPAQRQALRLAGDGAGLLALERRERELTALIHEQQVLVDTARTKQQADQLRAELTDLESQLPPLVAAAEAADPAVQEAYQAVLDWPKRLQELRDAFADAQRQQMTARNALGHVRGQIGTKAAQLRALYQPEAPAPASAPPGPREFTYSRHSEPLDQIADADLPAHMRAIAGRPAPGADQPNRSFVVTPDGITPNDGRPALTDRRA